MLVLAYGLPVLYALVVWWLSTGVVLYVVGRPRETHIISIAVISALAAAALFALYATRDDASVFGAYVAFTAALTVWAWHELTFLTGFVTGPRRTACPGRPDEPAAFRAPLRPAVESVIYHEVAIALTAAVVAAVTWSGENLVGFWTFVILWLMRLSAKLNIYFGVKNLTEQFLPPEVQYLKSYFCRRPMNAFFPIAVTSATVVTALLANAALASDAAAFDVAGLTFLATLMALAVLEHWFLVLPIPAERLWSWGLSSRAARADCDGAKGAKRIGMAAA
ncbi:MAG: putative photosynthetic complex assembly protein PuhE [Hyphomicrobium sp.]